MLFLARYGPSLLMAAVCLLNLARPLTGPISRYACAGMVYGAALPAGLEREAVVWIEGDSFGKAEMTRTSVKGLSRDIGVAQIHPNDATLNHIVSYLLSKRWQNTNRSLEAQWNVKLPPKLPTVVEDWYDEPLAMNLVDVQAAEVDVFTMHYDVASSRLTSQRIAWKRKTKDEAQRQP